ncbi:MAG: D-aminoacyl-tRNA deacylase [Candidatus Omnitrophica bacterium]|nr:D-aminoacyl-tRNA deacylase [Candidatus Omnitrophota bacterium]MDD5671510.1 D-aminoacyl-tRNA deacylase [Candidatus Omnitrophota bacterium]
MRALIQRVSEASVTIDEKQIASIGRGILVYLGVHQKDTGKDCEWVIKRTMQARIFENANGKFDQSVADIRGEILVVSEMTLYGDLRHGNRPDMIANMKPAEARVFFENFVLRLQSVSGLKVEKGEFGAHMKVRSVNDGPVTVMVDSL